MQIPFAAICSNVNYAQGLSKETPVSHEQTIKIMDTAAKKLTEIVTEIIQIS
jgi:purine nucleoside phosphorylase